jgi:predicted RNA-binding protein YlqC (UPF0109 family)
MNNANSMNESVDLGESLDDGEALSDTELLQEIIMTLVSNKNAIEIEVEDNAPWRNIYVYVDQDDVGRVIGRQGCIVGAIREVLNAAALHLGRRVTITVTYRGCPEEHGPGKARAKAREEEKKPLPRTPKTPVGGRYKAEVLRRRPLETS